MHDDAVFRPVLRVQDESRSLQGVASVHIFNGFLGAFIAHFVCVWSCVRHLQFFYERTIKYAFAISLEVFGIGPGPLDSVGETIMNYPQPCTIESLRGSEL